MVKTLFIRWPHNLYWIQFTSTQFNSNPFAWWYFKCLWIPKSFTCWFGPTERHKEPISCLYKVSHLRPVHTYDQIGHNCAILPHVLCNVTRQLASFSTIALEQWWDEVVIDLQPETNLYHIPVNFLKIVLKLISDLFASLQIEYQLNTNWDDITAPSIM